MGGKVLVPTGTMIKNLKAARLAADIADVPLIILARTDANAAKLITNDFDENDKPFLTGERSPEGFYYVKHGIDQAISRGLAYAPYSDLIWCETATPNLEEAKKFADAIQKNNRTRYISLCEYLNKEYSITVKDILPEEGKPFSKIYNKNKKELLLSDYSSLETKKLHAAAQIAQEGHR
jgi:isocitrate lyase